MSVSALKSPPGLGVLACLVLFGFGELSGALQGGYRQEIRQYAIARAQAHSAVHQLTGVEDIEGRAEVEAASWLVDFLADGGGAPDRELLVKLSEPASAADASIDSLLFVLARQVSRALAGALSARLSTTR